MVSAKHHTTFCSKNCRLSHHNLVTVLCLNSCEKEGQLPDVLKECIESYSVIGWDRNADVPDPSLQELRSPLLFLASAFGKADVVEALLNANFRARVLNRDGETPLHGALRHLYRTGALHSRGLKVASRLGPIKSREKAFKRIMFALSENDPKMLFVQDQGRRTAFHVAAGNMLESRKSYRFEKGFFYFCLTEMIQRLSELEDSHILAREEILDGLSATNEDGDTVSHMLARDSNYGFTSLKLLQDTFFSGALPSITNNENQTVYSIASDCDAEKATEFFHEFQEQGENSLCQTPLDERLTEEPLSSTSGENEARGAEEEPPTDNPLETELLLVEQESADHIKPCEESLHQATSSEAFATRFIVTPYADTTAGEATESDVIVFDSIDPQVFDVPGDNVFNIPTEVQVMFTTDVDILGESILNELPDTKASLTKHLSEPEVLGTLEDAGNTNKTLSDVAIPFTSDSPHPDVSCEKTVSEASETRLTSSTNSMHSFPEETGGPLSENDVALAKVCMPPEGVPAEEKATFSSDDDLPTHGEVPQDIHYKTSVGNLAASVSDVISSQSVDPDEPDNRDQETEKDFFLEFLVTEGVYVDSSAKKSIVGVVLAQHTAKLEEVEGIIPKLSEEIKESEAALRSQKEKVRHLEEELAVEKIIVAEKEDSLQRLTREQMSLCEQMVTTKRKMAYCENTIVELQGVVKKIRLE